MTADAWQWITIIWLAVIDLLAYRRIRFLEEQARIHEQIIAGMFHALLQAGFSITVVEEKINGSKETSGKGRD